ncbi:MAG: bifunctional diguanylate cyclase/phosphodiesterase [Pseudomonadota bacterium]
MMMGETHQTDAAKRVSERMRLIALCTGVLGLIINFFVCAVYTLSGEVNALIFTEVGIYTLILTVTTWCAYRRYRVRQTFIGGLLSIFVVFWVGTFVEGVTGQTAAFDYPLVLFIPLFLVIILPYRLLLSLAPVQAACVYYYTDLFALKSIGPNWTASEQMAYALIMAAFSGFSFCALGIVAFARERADTRLLDLISEKEALASTDGLTGLMNRRAFMEYLRRIWPNRSKVQIAFVDLDHFKPLNDQYGHAVGDQVLRTVAERIGTLPMVTATARLGGDEFAVLIDGTDSAHSIDSILSSLHASITGDIRWESGLITIGASIGFAEGVTNRQSLSGLLRSADTAMRRAKGGHLDWAIFNPHIDNAALATSTLELELKSAIKNGQIKAAIQPIADAKTRKTVAYELLTRWTESGFERDPSPKDFIPIAEKLGLLNEILWITLDEALNKVDLTERRLAVNVSPAQLLASDFLATLVSILERHAVSPSSITIEITEEVAFRNVERNVAVLNQARALGVSIALDDFGTGYSSLSMLDTLPLDKLKIDQSFVRKSDQSEQSKSILLAAIRLARQLGLESCVEGIETQEFAARVAVLGADHIQGYWIGRPQLVKDAKAALKLAS